MSALDYELLDPKGFDVSLDLYNGKRKLLGVDLRGRISVEVEIACCEKRISKGEATHYTVKSISSDGKDILKELEVGNDNKR